MQERPIGIAGRVRLNFARIRLRMIEPLIQALARSREVKTLMGLSGRVTWVLGAVAVATVYGSPGEITDTRSTVLLGCSVLWIFQQATTHICGMGWPHRFHYGASELMEQERMALGTRGDSHAGFAAPSEVPNEAQKPSVTGTN